MRKVLYILSRLADTDIEWLATVGQRRDVPPGTVLVQEGGPEAALIFVLDGEVSVDVSGVGQVARLGVGEILGEMSFVDRSPPSATVSALTPTRILAIDRDVMTRRLEADLAFAARFYHAVSMYLAVRLRATTQRLGREEPEPFEDINSDMLDTVHIAGAHFDRMIKQLLGV